jgi:hypothetical protein
VHAAAPSPPSSKPPGPVSARRYMGFFRVATTDDHPSSPALHVAPYSFSEYFLRLFQERSLVCFHPNTQHPPIDVSNNVRPLPTGLTRWISTRTRAKKKKASLATTPASSMRNTRSSARKGQAEAVTSPAAPPTASTRMTRSSACKGMSTPTSAAATKRKFRAVKESGTADTLGTSSSSSKKSKLNNKQTYMRPIVPPRGFARDAYQTFPEIDERACGSDDREYVTMFFL